MFITLKNGHYDLTLNPQQITDDSAAFSEYSGGGEEERSHNSITMKLQVTGNTNSRP